jgi:hypothetical protein
MPEIDKKDQVRSVKVSEETGKLGVTQLVLVAILLAAGFILNMTLGNALAITGIKPQFLIAAYCLAILLIQPKLSQGVLIGLLAAIVCQLTTSIPGLNFLTEAAGSLVITLFATGALSDKKAMPLIGAFCATLVSGLLFAVLGTFIMGAALATVLVKLPLVFGTAVFNAIVVQALIIPLRKAVLH